MNEKQVALVLSGGSALGLAHIGVIQVLQEAGYSFDAIYGVSAGAIIGAALADGMSGEEIEEEFFNTNLVELGWDLSRVSAGLIRGGRIRNFFNEFFNARDIEELEIPLSIGATDFISGEYLALSTGNIADALRASISLPLIFEPYKHPDFDNHLVDGGLTNNLPIADAIENYPGEHIIAINVHPLYPYAERIKKRSVFGFKKDIQSILRHSFNIMMNAQTMHISDERISYIVPKLERFSMRSFKRSDQENLIEAGREAARELLKELI